MAPARTRREPGRTAPRSQRFPEMILAHERRKALLIPSCQRWEEPLSPPPPTLQPVAYPRQCWEAPLIPQCREAPHIPPHRQRTGEGIFPGEATEADPVDRPAIQGETGGRSVSVREGGAA